MVVIKANTILYNGISVNTSNKRVGVINIQRNEFTQ